MLPFKNSLAPIIGNLQHVQSLGGGCIHHASRILSDTGTFFIKWNDVSEAPNFEVEAMGLALLRKHSPLRVPGFVAQLRTKKYAGLLLEFVEEGPKSPRFWQTLGEGLAQQHRHSQTTFGLNYDNYIGSLPQRNGSHRRWPDFFREERILPQLAMPQASRLISPSSRKRLDQLLHKAADLFPDEPPALLHGDLWGGNLLCDSTGQPVLIDPAVYFGHREMELAFMQLFDAHPAAFYAAYQEAYPLTSGWEARMDLYNLYPLLVHLNLFGASYLAGVERVIAQYA